MMLENVFLHLLKGANGGAELDEDINAVAFVLDHFLDAPNLAFYAVKTCQLGRVCCLVFCQSRTSISVC